MATKRPKAPRSKSSKKPTKKTPKKQHGGQREGAGRKQEKLPETLLAELGDPPEDPLKKTQWWNRLLEVLQYGVLRGKPWVTMLRDARANALVASKLVPEEIKSRAAQILENEDREANEDASPRVTKREGDPVARPNTGALYRNPT